MKLTEKELNEFPIGTKLEINHAVYIKTYNKEWIKQGTSMRFNSNYFVVDTFTIIDWVVEIPTYTEYIPPKPILDDKEKEYLSAVIRPFRKRISKIEKVKNPLYKSEWIRFSLICDSIIDDSFSLPSFKTGTMYKGMELDREYSLEELGL